MSLVTPPERLPTDAWPDESQEHRRERRAFELPAIKVEVKHVPSQPLTVLPSLLDVQAPTLDFETMPTLRIAFYNEHQPAVEPAPGSSWNALA